MEDANTCPQTMDEESSFIGSLLDSHGRFMFVTTYRHAMTSRDINDATFMMEVADRWYEIPISLRYLIARDTHQDVFQTPDRIDHMSERFKDEPEVMERLDRIFHLYATDIDLIPYRTSIFSHE